MDTYHKVGEGVMLAFLLMVVFYIIAVFFMIGMMSRRVNGYPALPRRRKARSAVAARPVGDGDWPLYNADERSRVADHDL